MGTRPAAAAFWPASRRTQWAIRIYPEVSLRLARRRRDEARKLLARDIDPSAYRKAQKQSRRQRARNSFEAVAAEWLAKHVPNWSTGHARRIERELALNALSLHRREAGRRSRGARALRRDH